MNDAAVAMIVVTATTISLAHVQGADIHLSSGDAVALATAALPDYRAGTTIAIALAQTAEASIEIAAIYQPSSSTRDNPRFTYDASGRLSVIDYDGSAHKILAYANDRLVTIEYFDGRIARRRDFIYDAAGALIQITES